MAQVKVFARYALIAVGGATFFASCSLAAAKAAHAAVSLGAYAVVWR